MKADQVLYYVLFLLAGSIGGYFIGAHYAKPASNGPAPLVTPNDEKETPVPVASAPVNTTENATASAPANPAENTAAAAPATAPAATPAATTAAAPVTAAASVPSATTSSPGPALPSASLCFSGDQELETDLNLYASKIEALKLMYSHELKQDCSGIFYRLVDEFAKKKCNTYDYPVQNAAGPAFMIAKWYSDHKNFNIVNDPMVSRNLIKPGAVMFYGAPGAKFNNATADRLCVRGGIFHVGVVTAVTKDASGNVTQYTLFHGRSTGKTAGRTSYHNVRGPSNLGDPILGVGTEEWVGISYLFTPKG